MATYNSKNGVVYTIRSGYHCSGEVIILSDDKEAWKVPRAELAAVSPLLGKLVADTCSGPVELPIPDATGYQIEHFIGSVNSDPDNLYPIPIQELAPVITIMVRFGCKDLAKQVLYRSSGYLEPDELIQAFAMASQLDDIKSGCRILLQGKCWYDATSDFPGEGISLLPNSDTDLWDPIAASKIQSGWMWALSTATGNIVALEKASGSDDSVYATQRFWTSVTGEFMRYMTR